MLEARGLTLAPPGRGEPVVRDLSLVVAPGEWVAVTGRNGGGKTTLALALAGLWPRRAGEVTWRGRTIGPDHDASARAEIACILQDPSSQLLEATVAAEIAIGARHAGLASGALESAVRAWAERFGLEPELARDPHALSAGAQQRTLLAAALAAQPGVLVADEPAAHLDPGWRERAIACVNEARARGLAVLWVTQDPRERAAADRVIELEAAPGLPLAPATHLDPGPPRARVAVAVATAAPNDGPSIVVGAPVEIVLGTRGVTALEGPNGVGKSVLLSAIAGLVTIPSVQVTWTDQPAERSLLTLQYPELQVFEERVDDEIAFASVARGRDRSEALAEARDTLGALGVDGVAWLSRRTWELSTGEKRLVELVAALVAPAGLLLLDEPTAGLDPARRRALADLVVRRARAGPILLASQDLEWVRAIGAMRVRLGGTGARGADGVSPSLTRRSPDP